MNVVQKRLKDIVPYANNTKQHDKTQIKNVAESIKQFGFVQPIVIDANDVIVIGHCRAMAAEMLGMDLVPCVCVDDLTPEQVNALRIVDNKTNESEWDLDLLALELPQIDLDAFDFDFGMKDTEEKDETYTQKIKVPQYQITGECPELSEMYDQFKESALIREIEQSTVTDEEKDFLRAAARRHCVFNYRNIAEYYAHATPEMQELMEKSALVIIDYDDAIANGYVKLSKRLEELRNGT